MMPEAKLHPGDLVVIGLGLLLMVAIGLATARRSRSSDGYFMAGRRMPGWIVGFSLMATIISSMSFLALPEFAYRADWRFLGTCAAYPVALLFALTWYMPLFRRGKFSSAYEYLERRFGLWARGYAALAFVLILFFRMGIILYASSAAIGAMTDYDLAWIILAFGLVVIAYTVLGGLEAVIWTDVIQGLGLMIGGAVCLPLICWHLPNGFAQIVREAGAAGKTSLAAGEWGLVQSGFLVILVGHVFEYTRMATTDQMFIQRYCAPKSEREARGAIVLGVATSVPVWFYFTLLGTALWAFYRQCPDPRVAGLKAVEVFPHFLATQLPAGLTGFVVTALIMAAMSTLDSSINACAATVVNDFYRRLFVGNRTERHYLRAGRLFSVAFGGVMIVTALVIHYTRTTTLQELQAVLLAIFGSGLPGLFLLGFLTTRARSLPSLAAMAMMLVGVGAWLWLGSEAGASMFPAIQERLPHKFWLYVFTNVFVFVVGYGLSVAVEATVGGERKDMKRLTVWARSDARPGGDEVDG